MVDASENSTAEWICYGTILTGAKFFKFRVPTAGRVGVSATHIRMWCEPAVGSSMIASVQYERSQVDHVAFRRGLRGSLFNAVMMDGRRSPTYICLGHRRRDELLALLPVLGWRVQAYNIWGQREKAPDVP